MRTLTRFSFAVLFGAVPAIALAVSAVRQEFLDAMRAAPDRAHGAELYETCAACHGERGGGVSGGSVPAIGGQHFAVIVKQLVDFRHDRRWDVRMEYFADRHHLQGAQDIADVAAHVSRLERTAPASIGPGTAVEHGAGVYLQFCAGCHGATGQGDAEQLVPRLAGQHFAYLERQFYDAVEGRRPNLEGEHERLLRQLDRQDIIGIADYLSRMLPAPAGTAPPRQRPGTATAPRAAFRPEPPHPPQT